MSDTMLLGVLRMPVDDHGDIGLMQFIGRAREAADRIEADAVRIEALESAIKFQASAAKRGMDAASSVGYHMEKEARRLHAECSPEALESERDANAKLTEELERALGREQALAAHVDGIRAAYAKDCPMALACALNTAPETSLARLKAQWQAEAVMAFRGDRLIPWVDAKFPGNPSGVSSEISSIAATWADDLRRQAEEGDNHDD